MRISLVQSSCDSVDRDIRVSAALHMCGKNQKVKPDFGGKNANLGEVVERTAYIVFKASLGNRRNPVELTPLHQRLECPRDQSCRNVR